MTAPGGRASEGIGQETLPQGELSPEIADALKRLDDLVQAFERHPEPTVREDVFDLLRSVDSIHRCGLRRIVGVLKEAGLVESVLHAPEVRLLVELYQLGEGGEQARVGSVLDALRPYVQSHGGHLELLEVEAGLVKLRLHGACHGSKPALRDVVEQALRAHIGDVVRVQLVEELPVLPLTPIPVPVRPGERPARESPQR